MSLKFGSLFSGFGGLDLGLERAGMTCVWQCEINPYARRVLAKHWPHVQRWDDVRTFPPDSSWGKVNLIVGGDPCQTNSVARGKSKATEESPAIHFIRIIEEIRPRIVLRENPPSQQSAPWPWYRFRDYLESLGYTVLPFRLRACCFGAEHQRERVFLLAELANPNSVHTQERIQTTGRKGSTLPITRWGTDKPGVDRALDGVTNRVERLKGLGNAVVPQVSEWIGRRIVEIVTREPNYGSEID